MSAYRTNSLETPSGKHEVGCRVAVVAPVTVAMDIAEVLGAIQTYGASPVARAGRSPGKFFLRHALEGVILVLGAVGLEVPIGLEWRFP